MPEKSKATKVSRTWTKRGGGQPHVVVIGAGMAGIMSAHTVLRRAPNIRLTIVEPRAKHMLQAALPLCAVGEIDQAKIIRPTESLVPRQATLLKKSVEEVDPVRKSVKLSDGQELSYDILVPASVIRPN
jgi:sulfide:quinone oxidoreductase